MTVAHDAAAPSRVPSLMDSRYRLQVVGVLVVVTVGAIEAMSVATIMPTVARALHGLRYYSWGFTSFLLADVVGMVDAGRRCDRRGPGPSLLGGLGAFAAGLLVASLAPDIWVFLTGRLLQGLGGGSMIVAVFVVVGRAFPKELHPRIMASLSAAWVVPSLVGPALAGIVASELSWRWVYAGIAPFALGGVVLLIPVLRSMRELPPPAPNENNPPGIVPGIALAVGLGLVQAAGQAVDWWSLLLVVAGLGLGWSPLRRLLPGGSLRLARGLPSVIALRGILTCAFFGAEAFLPLTLTRLHGGTPRVVGVPLTVAALGWTAGSWWQGRHSHQPLRLLRNGFLVAAIGIGSLSVMAASSVSLWAGVPIWTVAGLGMGLAMPTISVRMLELTPGGAQGANSSALHVSDMVGSVLGIALAGCLVSSFGLDRLPSAIVIADASLAGVAVLGIFASRRAA